MNKQGEGRASSMFMVVTIVLVTLTIISSIIIGLVGNYGVESLPEFEAYQDIYGNVTSINQEIISSQDQLLNETPQDNERYEDSIFRKGIKTIVKFPKQVKYLTKSILRTRDQFGFSIPDEVIFLITTIISITIIILVIKAYWRFKEV